MYSNEIYPIKIAFLQEPLGMTPKRIALEKHGLSENQNVGLNWNNGKKNWLVVWNINFIVPYIGNDHPNWRNHIFQRGKPTTNPETGGVTGVSCDLWRLSHSFPNWTWDFWLHHIIQKTRLAARENIPHLLAFVVSAPVFGCQSATKIQSI